MTDPYAEVPEAETYVIVQIGRNKDMLASRDLYDSEEEAFDIAGAMEAQECGEPGAPGYSVFRLESVIPRDARPTNDTEDLGPEDYEYVDLNDLPF